MRLALVFLSARRIRDAAFSDYPGVSVMGPTMLPPLPARIASAAGNGQGGERPKT